MEIAKSYITDVDGSITGVVVDLATYRKMEEALLDRGLSEAMADVKDEPNLSAEEMKQFLGE